MKRHLTPHADMLEAPIEEKLRTVSRTQTPLLQGSLPLPLHEVQSTFFISISKHIINVVII